MSEHSAAPGSASRRSGEERSPPDHTMDRWFGESDAYGELKTAGKGERHRPKPVPRVVHELEVVAVFADVHRGVIADHDCPWAQAR